MSQVRSVSRALAVLRVLASGPQRITDLARRTALAKGTVARLLATLEAEGVVVQDADARYRLAPAFGGLAPTTPTGPDLVALARPELEQLARSIGEAAGLSVADGSAVRYVDQVSPQNEVQVRDWTGTTAPMHVVSSGHVFLAAMSTAELRALLPARLDALTPHTIDRRSVLERRLAEVRRTGYAWVRDEFAEGISSVAAPVPGPDGAPVAAIHIHGPSFRFPRAGQEAAIAALVVGAAHAVSMRIAGR